MTEKLLPCPFCGSEAEVEEQVDDYDTNWQSITCSNRKCFVREAYAQSISDWNTRAPLPQGEEAV